MTRWPLSSIVKLLKSSIQKILLGLLLIWQAWVHHPSLNQSLSPEGMVALDRLDRSQVHLESVGGNWN